ncbi:outer membrane protein assembly factor BamB family protein [Thalassoglobus polymorphus]|uniref:Outer membrane protein assembly factor BamB n=1 Tax=Thalassoglobus polymorphus TaxID=2527994 RepID=A0A517QHK4_9PLAN|nr:PQQ-binding-like beta-propeller repeat protein [Thalassoglobus polymorphus]QDT31111.1 Outer membrane protein assembly factor BamB [Thalassoglobus polymorphus]
MTLRPSKFADSTQCLSPLCACQGTLFQARFLAVAVLFFVIQTNLTAQVIRNQLQVSSNINANAERLFTGILLDLEANDHNRVAEDLQKLRSEFAGIMVPVASHQQIEASLLADFLTQHISEASSSLSETPVSDETIIESDGFELWRLLLTSRTNPETLLSVGDRQWKEGRISIAKRCWRIARTETAVFLPVQQRLAPETFAEISKREIVAEMLTGHFREATSKLQRLQNVSPDVSGRVAGEEGNLAELLNQQMQSLRQGPPEAFLQLDKLMPIKSVRFSLEKQAWSVEMTRGASRGKAVRPIFWNDLLLLHDANGLRALNKTTGQSAWPVDENDDGFLFETAADRPSRDRSQMAIARGALHENILYVCTGHSGSVNDGNLAPSEKSRVSAFNLEAEGRLDWTVAADSLPGFGPDRQLLFTGSPVIVQDQLLLPVRSLSPGSQLQIACLNQADGSVQWIRDVAANLQVPDARAVSFDDHIIRSEGCLLWLIDGETLCCIHERSGQVQWISGIDPTSRIVSPGFSGERSCFASEGVVYCATRNGVAAFDLYSGSLLWEQFLAEPPQQVLGLNDGLLVLSTPGMMALDCFTGRVEWKQPGSTLPSHSNQGELIGRTVLWPRSSEIWTLDAQTGRLLQRDQYQKLTGQLAHGLMLSGKKLYIDEGDRFSAIEVDTRMLEVPR